MSDTASSLLAVLSIFSSGAVVGASLLYGYYYANVNPGKEQVAVQAELEQRAQERAADRKKLEDERRQKFENLYSTQGYLAALTVIEEEMLCSITPCCDEQHSKLLASSIIKIREEALLQPGGVSSNMERRKLVLFQQLAHVSQREARVIIRTIDIINGEKSS